VVIVGYILAGKQVVDIMNYCYFYIKVDYQNNYFVGKDNTPVVKIPNHILVAYVSFFYYTKI